MSLAKQRDEIEIKEYPPDTIGDGSQTVTTAGTRVQLSTSSIPCKKVIIMGKTNNTGDIYVGGANVSSSRGVVLVARQTVTLDIDNLNKVYIDAQTNGEGVVFTYVV